MYRDELAAKMAENDALRREMEEMSKHLISVDDLGAILGVASTQSFLGKMLTLVLMVGILALMLTLL